MSEPHPADSNPAANPTGNIPEPLDEEGNPVGSYWDPFKLSPQGTLGAPASLYYRQDIPAAPASAPAGHFHVIAIAPALPYTDLVGFEIMYQDAIATIFHRYDSRYNTNLLTRLMDPASDFSWTRVENLESYKSYRIRKQGNQLKVSFLEYTSR